MIKRTFFVLLFFISALFVQAQLPNPLMLTPATKFVGLPDDCYWVSDLDEGVWTVEHVNEYGFFLEDGRMLFDFEWASNNNREPQMFDGAVIMYKKGQTYNKPQYILYRNGNVKELPAELTGAATNFVDGVALIGKKNGFNVEYIYVNTRGERVYGDLVSVPDRFDNKNWTIPPLREGLRAYKNPKSEDFVKKWGFIDDKGKVVIPAKYDKVRSFNEGYALVKEGDKIYFIDKKGNKAFEPKWGNDVYFDRISDVHEGLVLVEGSPRTYYNLHGEKVRDVMDGTVFVDGYAFCADEVRYNGKSRVMDNKFNIVRTIPDVGIDWDDFCNCPAFGPAGVATVKHSRVIEPDGTVLIEHYAADGGNVRDNGIDGFSRSGYAKAWLNHNGERYEGFINMQGEFVIVYKWNHSVTQINSDPRNPSITDNSTSYPEYPILINPIENEKPIGPVVVNNVLYTVSVSASPAEGGTVSGSGKYKLGDRVKLSATPNKEWRLDKWECKTPGFYSKEPGEISIDGRDLTFEATFIKKPEKDSIDDISNSGAYSAHQVMVNKKDGSKWDFDVYMELDAKKTISSPYGQNTYGFLTCMIDGDKPIVSDQYVNGAKSTISTNAFFVPMKIVGMTKDKDGRRFLVLDGGQLMVSNIRLGDNAGLAGLFVAFIMEMNGGTFGTASSARYKLELTEYDEETGECTFGDLYRFHSEKGWLPSDKYPTKKSNGFFAIKTEDTSIDPEFFRGLKMKMCSKQKVEFVPPASWRESDYEKYAKEFLQSISETVNDYDVYFGK